MCNLSQGIYQQGVAEGITAGIEQGIEQGIEKGIEKGVQQGKKDNSIEIAQNLLTMGLTKEQILEATKISEEEYQALLDK